MAGGTEPGGSRGRGRPAPWKRRLRISDLAVAIALLAADFALLRASGRMPYFALVPLLGLLALMVGFVWRHVGRRWERVGYVAALILYLFFLAIYLASWNPLLMGPPMRAAGIQ